MEHLAVRLAAIPGVVAVSLGGSRATNTAVEDSDWDFGSSRTPGAGAFLASSSGFFEFFQLFIR